MYNSSYGTQQTIETIKSNVSNWHALHSNVPDNGSIEEAKREQIKKCKIRMIEAFRRNKEK